MLTLTLERRGTVSRNPENDLLVVNGMLAVSLVLSRCRRTAAGALRWVVRLDEGLEPDLTIAVRMNSSNEVALDYYLLPSLDVHAAGLRIKEENGIYLDLYRFDSLDSFFEMAEVVSVESAA